MKLKIAICDDEKNDLDLQEAVLKQILDKMSCCYEIDKYISGEALIEDINKIKEYDALLLDIDMPNVNGIEVAEKLMPYVDVLHVIFVTNRDDMVFEAIHYRPFRFIRKEYLSQELEEAFCAIVKKISEECVLYDFKSGKDSYKLRLKDILYLESKRHYLYIHTDDDIIITRGKISEYEEKLKNFGFIRIHIGYLVNSRSIYSITSKKVTLDDGEDLPISRKRTEEIKQMHATFVRRYVRGIY